MLYFAAFVVLDPGTTNLTYKQVITDKEFKDAEEAYGKGSFRAGMGAESVKELLKALDLDEIATQLRNDLESMSRQQQMCIRDRYPSEWENNLL